MAAFFSCSVMVIIRIDNHICSNNSINLKVLASLHIPSIISLSGYTIWVFGNSNTDQSQLAVRHGNRQEIEHVWLPLTEVQEGFQLTETHVTCNRFSYRFQLTETISSDIGFMQCVPKEATELAEITQNNSHYAIQRHSRSPILVPIKSSYVTSY